MNLVLIAMIITLLIPIFEAWRDNDIWQKMLAFASIATKTAMMIMVRESLALDVQATVDIAGLTFMQRLAQILGRRVLPR